MLITIIVLGILLGVSVMINIITIIMWNREYSRSTKLKRRLNGILNDSKAFKFKED